MNALTFSFDYFSLSNFIERSLVSLIVLTAYFVIIVFESEDWNGRYCWDFAFFYLTKGSFVGFIFLGCTKVPVVLIVSLFFYNLFVFKSTLSKVSLCKEDVLTSFIRKEREDDWLSLFLLFLLSLDFNFCLFYIFCNFYFDIGQIWLKSRNFMEVFYLFRLLF